MWTWLAGEFWVLSSSLPSSSALSDDIIKVAKDIKPITEIHQTGNTFVITSKTPNKSVTNTFTLGKEAEMTAMDGKKVKVSHTQLFENYLTILLYTVQSPSLKEMGSSKIRKVQ